MVAESFTQTTMQAPHTEEAIQRLLESVGGTAGIPGLLDTPYQNYNQLAEAGLQDPRLAGFTPDQIDAFDLAREGIGAYQPYLNRADEMVNDAYGSSQNLLQRSSQLGSIDPYMNPYTQNVIDTTMLEMNRQQAMQQDALDAKAAQAKAFGGSRHGLAEVEMERAHDQNRALMAAQLYDKGYTNAQNMRESHRQRQGQAGLGMGQVGINAANTQMGIGETGQGMYMKDVGTLGTIGGAQQNQLQTQYDINYNQWLDEYQDPWKRASFMSDIIRGVPSSQQVQHTGVQAQPSELSQGIGALGQFASIGNQFGWWGNPANASG